MENTTLAIALIAALMCINVTTKNVAAATKPPIADLHQIIYDGMNTPNIKATLQKIQQLAVQEAWKTPEKDTLAISDTALGTLTKEGITLQLTFKLQLLSYEMDTAKKAITPQNLTSPQARELMMDIRNRLDVFPKLASKENELREHDEDMWLKSLQPSEVKLALNNVRSRNEDTDLYLTSHHDHHHVTCSNFVYHQCHDNEEGRSITKT
ncbi:MAG: hypothetical protein WC365_04220 [Candidatus Babeliales bacterium]|jgi:hypothetical protein